jgi:RNA polymerase sigma-70 factor (ECF subfamily)
MKVPIHEKTIINNWVKQHRAQLLAVLIGKIKDFQLAEDALQEAFTKVWLFTQQNGLPKHPKSWVLKTASNYAIDRLRRTKSFNEKSPQITQLLELAHETSHDLQLEDDEAIEDERLKLIFICCHPALDFSSQVALTLNTVCGFSTEQVAATFLLKRSAMAQRLVRAKSKIKRTGIAFKTPEVSHFSVRLEAVMAVIYQIYNYGYYASDNTTLMNQDCSNEAIDLATNLKCLLEKQKIPAQAELYGLLALMDFHKSRSAARNKQSGTLILLSDQDRRLWDQTLIENANAWFTKAITLKSMGIYQIQAAISGVHSQAKAFKDTDWRQIVSLYQKLYEYLPTDTVKINLAVAMDYNLQSEVAIKLLQEVEYQTIEYYLPYYLASAQILTSLGRKHEAMNRLSTAMALSKNKKEKILFKGQIELLKH